MRELVAEVTGRLNALDLPRPCDPDVLLTHLVRVAADMRGREIVLRQEVFPHKTATGLWLVLDAYDIIAVDRRAGPGHKLVIVGHEIWHMLEDDYGSHGDGEVMAAARLLDSDGMGEAVARVLAARSSATFHEGVEQDAERFGLRLGQALKPWLEGQPDQDDCSALARRIGASLGHRVQ
ncbi:toxin-antitoxin system, toxin component [Streptomyces tauricus]|uniref:toxin-antitoxin system, toxin component n=1 Tax=Streptomyces tauricus TaxID=68274 RepID=UPI00224364BC|nr:toxin-antitoxin system, toxin component [Streptomyces tauricus]MCW8102231.1 toxin-antitoxin system, toxin component [Streptomyces tauricus]